MGSSPSPPAGPECPGADKAGKSYWDRMWETGALPEPIDPHRRGLKNYPFRRFHNLFERVFQGQRKQGKKLIEIGCAQSVFLPYFAKHFGFEVAGLDRSEGGCEGARSILKRDGVDGEIFCADLFSPPQHLLQEFDVLVSFGVVEHWENPSAVLSAMSKVLRSEGRMITVIPNLNGLPGALQRVMDRAVYDIHIPLNREGLASAHRLAGLEVERCDYFLPIALEVLNVESWSKGLPCWVTMRSYGVISRLVWLWDDHVTSLSANPWTSPYVVCVARKP
jgi:2-polyprenyl-3-methyl-5-hydroxy-6-metoxy-1,4-benzoquinol methylase